MARAPVVVDESVYAAVRAAAEHSRWLRVVVQVERAKGEEQYVLSMMSALLDWVDGQLVSHDFQVPARQVVTILDWFDEKFMYEGWTRVILACERDGPDSATVMTEPGGPREVDYVGFEEHSFRDYVEEHRAELEELGRRLYGSPRRGLFRR